MNEAYLSSVQAALWGGQVEWPAEQTKQLFRLHAMQGTGPLVYTRLLEQKDLPAEVRQPMKAVCVQNMQTLAQIYRIQEQAWRALEAAGIKAVLMKGAGLAALYPSPEMRQWGDVDVFVGKKQYHAAAKVMRETFPNALKFDEELDHYKHYNLIADGVSIEIHRISVSLSHPRDVRRYTRMETFGMTHAEKISINGQEIRIPEPTFNALMVFLHSWEHLLTKGANVRQLCDLALLLHHSHAQIDTRRLKQWLRSLCLTDVWQLYMWILVNRLGLSTERAPFYINADSVARRAERMMTLLLAEPEPEVKQPEANMPTNRFVRKWGTMLVRLRNARRLTPFSPAYARHMSWAVLLSGAARLFAKDRHWE